MRAFPSGTVGEVLLAACSDDHWLIGAEASIEVHDEDATPLRGRLRIASLRLAPEYGDRPLVELEEPHARPLKFVVECDVLEGDFHEIAMYGDALSRMESDGDLVRSELRIDPSRTRSGGRWEWSSLLFAPSDASARERIIASLSNASDGPSIAYRIAKAALVPAGEKSLARWLPPALAETLKALDWSSNTRVARDGRLYELSFEGAGWGPDGIYGRLAKPLFRITVWDAARSQLIDIVEQEVFVGPSPWSALTTDMAPLDEVLERWSGALFAGIRRHLETTAQPASLRIMDLPLSPWFDIVAAEHLKNGPVPTRPRAITPRDPVSLHLEKHRAEFAFGDDTIELETLDPWSSRVVLTLGGGESLTLYSSAEELHTVVAGELAEIRDVFRALHESAIEHGDPRLLHPANDDDDDYDDDVTTPLTELLGYIPDEELIDWRCNPDNLERAEMLPANPHAERIWSEFVARRFTAV